MTETAAAPITPTSLRVVASPHPFAVETTDVEMPAGGTVLDLILAAGCERALMAHAHVFLTDRAMTREPIYIPRENWTRVRPRPGMHLAVRVVPGKSGGSGGKSPLRTILTIAVIVASFAVPQLALAGQFGTGLQAFASTGHLFGEFYLGAALIGAVTPIVGNAAINLPAPVS